MTHRKMKHALYLQTLRKVSIVIRDSVQYKDINNTGINLNFQKPNTALLKQPQGVDLNEEEEAICVFRVETIQSHTSWKHKD